MTSWRGQPSCGGEKDLADSGGRRPGQFVSSRVALDDPFRAPNEHPYDGVEPA
ncbi:MAG TPA: hypothetical protein VFV66_00170 [Nonomuraea sp.]|nr:hypothetical protein [Nonomuraea sp.]